MKVGKLCALWIIHQQNKWFLMISKVCMSPVTGKFSIYCYFFEGIIWLLPHIVIPCLSLLECREAFGALLLWVCLWALCRWVHHCFAEQMTWIWCRFSEGFTLFLLQRGGGRGHINLLGSLGFSPSAASKSSIQFSYLSRDLHSQFCSQSPQEPPGLI